MRPGKPTTDFVSVRQLYKKIQSQGFKFYCVGCNRERRLATPAIVGSPTFFAHIFLTASVLTLVTYPWLHWKGLFAFVIPVGLVFEVLYRLKMRAALVCPECEFDPLLYLSDKPQALRQVEAAWRTKFTEKNLPFPERRTRSRVLEKKPESTHLTSL